MTKESSKGADKASKAGAAKSPQDTAGAVVAGASKGTHQVAEGHRISLKGKTHEAGHRVSAADFITKRDPDGKAGLQRLVDGGELVKASGKAAKDEGERAGGGLLDEGGGTGAGPSAAQIQAADTGNDPAAAAVVDAALSGSVADLENANDAGAADKAE